MLIVGRAKDKDKVLYIGGIYWKCVLCSCKIKVFTIGMERIIFRCNFQYDTVKVKVKIKSKNKEELAERPSNIR